ncbi:unnamed protein product [Pylaiella littoralis]
MVNSTFVYCEEGQYWDGRDNECKMCTDLELNPQGVDCRMEGTLLETLPLVEGYWRASDTSTTIRECFNDNACVGSSLSGISFALSSADDYCARGYMGPYCAVCVNGHTTGVSHTCHSCDSSYWAVMVVIMALTLVVLIVGTVIVLNDLVGNPALTDLSDGHFSVLSRRLRTVPFHKLKIPLVVVQIMTQYASTTSIEFPPVFQTFLSAVSVINLEFGWGLSSVCIIEVDFHDNLLAATVGPLLFLAVLFCTYLYTCKKHGLQPRPRGADGQASYPMSSYRTSPMSSSETETDEPERSVLMRVQDKYTTVALTMAFLLYSTISTVIFRTFTCDELDDVGERYLRADYGIDCDSSRHRAFQIYAGLMILVYPIGIPIAFAVMLWRKRSIINPPKEVLPPGGVALNNLRGSPEAGEQQHGLAKEPDPRLSDRRIAQTAFLWRAYRPGAYYFEVLECFRRLLLTGCLVFILPNSAGQAAVASVLSVLTVGVFALVNPFSDSNDHRAYTLGALAIFLTMFMGLVVKVDLADEETQSQLVLGVLLILLTVALLVVAVVECLWEARRLSRRERGADDDDHIFLRRRRGDNKAKDGGIGGIEMDDKHKTSGSLYAPKLLDVPMNRGFGAAKNSNNSDLFEAEKAAAAAAAAAAGRGNGNGNGSTAVVGGPRPRGAQIFVLSSAGDRDRAHVAIAGTSSIRHPSADRGSLIAPAFPAYRGAGSIGIIGIAGSGGGGGGGDSSLSARSASGGSHSPSPVFSGSDLVRKDSGGGGGGGGSSPMHSDLVPAEAESTPAGMTDAGGLDGGGGGLGGGGGRGRGGRGVGGRGGGRKKSKKGSKKSRRDGPSRSSSRRSTISDAGMRPAMPDDGPTDEMRPSPADGAPGAPGPWV